MRLSRKIVTTIAATSAAMMMLVGCGAGDGSGQAGNTAGGQGGTGEQSGSGQWSLSQLNIDFATYNPLSLVVRDQGFLEEALGPDVYVNWIQSAGSNVANEFLRAGELHVGSTAGAAALQARANGSPVQVITVYSQPEWGALVVRSDSDINSVADLAGRRIAAIAGTDPLFFLLQALDQAGLGRSDVQIVSLQHADGRAALERGDVDAWMGLDPIMAAGQFESDLQLIYRNIDMLSYGTLLATESFIDNHADVAQAVADAYQQARLWALDNPDQLSALLADVAGIDAQVASIVIEERTILDISPVPGQELLSVLELIGGFFVEDGSVANQGLVDNALATLFAPQFAQQAAGQ